MKKAEECEYFDTGQCKALIKEGAMFRDESCLNEDRSSCCYRCFRKDSCETSCDYLDNLETDTGSKTTDSSNGVIVSESGTPTSRRGVCPKCGGEMIEGTTSNYVRILKPGDFSGDLVSALYCRECGFVEFYKEPSTKEPWRLQKEQQEQSLRPEQTQPEEKESSHSIRRRMVR